jgi:coenzyme PQQ precursor peptide PqqA
MFLNCAHNAIHQATHCESPKLKETIMWTTPAATEMRFGFEVTMYVMNK